MAVAAKRLVFLPPYFTRFKRVCMEIDKKKKYIYIDKNITLIESNSKEICRIVFLQISIVIGENSLSLSFFFFCNGQRGQRTKRFEKLSQSVVERI